MLPSATPPSGYRRNVGIMLINRDAMVFVGRRVDMRSDSWQMPQGGIDPGEHPHTAALRELHEEVGTRKAVIVAECPGWLTYDLPEAVRRKLWRGRWRGQSQKWFAMRFTGTDDDIDIDTKHPEFDAWQWVTPDRLVDLIVPFKRELYGAVLEQFRPILADWNGQASA